MEFLIPRIECGIRLLLDALEFLLQFVDRLRIFGYFDLSQFRFPVRGCKAVFADPGLDPGAAPAGVNQPDRNLEIPVKLTAEVKSECAEILHSFRGAHFPARSGDRGAFHVRGDHAFRLVQTNLRIDRAFGLFLSVFAAPERAVAPDRHAHVGLTRAEPHFPDQNIAEGDAFRSFRSGHGHGIRSARFTGGKNGFPDSVFIRRGADRLSVDGHIDAFPAFRSPDNLNRLVALENHVVPVDVVHGEFFRVSFLAGLEHGAGAQHKRCRNGERDVQKFFHTEPLSLFYVWLTGKNIGFFVDFKRRSGFSP